MVCVRFYSENNFIWPKKWFCTVRQKMAAINVLFATLTRLLKNWFKRVLTRSKIKWKYCVSSFFKSLFVIEYRFRYIKLFCLSSVWAAILWLRWNSETYALRHHFEFLNILMSRWSRAFNEFLILFLIVYNVDSSHFFANFWPQKFQIQQIDVSDNNGHTIRSTKEFLSSV